MKFTVDNKTYFVKWEYEHQEPHINKSLDKVLTHCYIYDNNSSYNEPLVEGYAVKDGKDKFCKNTGRKISLDRALNKLFIKEDRAIAWQEYFKESPKRLK